MIKPARVNKAEIYNKMYKMRNLTIDYLRKHNMYLPYQ